MPRFQGKKIKASTLIIDGEEFCRNGHLLNKFNLYIKTDRNGYTHRWCVQCRRDNTSRYKVKKKEKKRVKPMRCQQKNCTNIATHTCYWPNKVTKQCWECSQKLAAVGRVMGVSV